MSDVPSQGREEAAAAGAIGRLGQGGDAGEEKPTRSFYAQQLCQPEWMVAVPPDLRHHWCASPTTLRRNTLGFRGGCSRRCSTRHLTAPGSAAAAAYTCLPRRSSGGHSGSLDAKAPQSSWSACRRAARLWKVFPQLPAARSLHSLPWLDAHVSNSHAPLSPPRATARTPARCTQPRVATLEQTPSAPSVPPGVAMVQPSPLLRVASPHSDHAASTCRV